MLKRTHEETLRQLSQAQRAAAAAADALAGREAQLKSLEGGAERAREGLLRQLEESRRALRAAEADREALRAVRMSVHYIPLCTPPPAAPALIENMFCSRNRWFLRVFVCF